MARTGAAMMAGKLASAGPARLAHASRCHACRGGLRSPLGTRGIEVRAYATHALQTDHSSGRTTHEDDSRSDLCAILHHLSMFMQRAGG